MTRPAGARGALMHWHWHRNSDGWLWECGRAYVHWNAPPLPSLFLGWGGCWTFHAEVDTTEGWWGSVTLCQDREDGEG